MTGDMYSDLFSEFIPRDDQPNDCRFLGWL